MSLGYKVYPERNLLVDVFEGEIELGVITNFYNIE